MLDEWLACLGELSPRQLVDWTCAKGFGDGHPLFAPTRGQVLGICETGSFDPKERIGTLPPLDQPVTIGEVALCTVMAGGDSRHLPVVLACLQALQYRELNSVALLTTTGSAALAIIVNGPLAKAGEFNGAANCLGPGSRGNSVVGRAVSLATRMLGGAVPGRVDMATLGQPAKFGLCFAENELASPFLPLHVERGYSAEESTVTVTAISGTAEVFNGHAVDEYGILETLAAAIWAQHIGVGALLGTDGTEPVVVMSPEWAHMCSSAGMSKEDVKKELLELSCGSFELVSRATSASSGQGRLALEGVLLVVAGGVGIKQAICGSWGSSRSVTVPISAGSGRAS